MTGEVINLRQARKDRARQEREKVAEENRAKFGRTKSEKQKIDAENRKATADLDGHRRPDRHGDD